MAENKSPVWVYFEKSSDLKYGKCKICNKSVSRDNGNTSNLTKHVEKNHKREYADLREKLSERREKKEKRKVEAAEAGYGKTNETRGKQMKMEHFTRETKQWEKSDWRQKQGNIMLAHMICIDYQPPSVVEDRGFREFVSTIQPAYHIPDRRVLSSTIIPELYNESVAGIKERLCGCPSLGITIDHWTSCANHAYMSITGHFLSEEFSINDCCLNVRPMSESHTAVNISEAVLDSLKSWKPEYESEKIPIFVVSDNCANVQAALRILPQNQFTGLSCFAHTLQLCINESIKEFSGLEKVIAKAKNIASFFHHSSQATYKLSEFQKAMKFPEHKLKQHCPTRWNSTYYLMERLVEQKEPVTAVLASTDKITNLQPHEWRTASSYVDVLRPFEGVTTMMSASRYATISMVIPTLNILKTKMESSEMDSFGKTMIRNLNKRWSGYETDAVYSVSSFLDPRFKGLVFSNQENRDNAAERVITHMIKIYENSKYAAKINGESSQSSESTNSTFDTQNLSSESVNLATSESESGKSVKATKFDIWDTFKTMIAQKQTCDSPGDTATITRARMEHELELYNREELLEPSASPYSWWGKNSNIFPTLSKLARIYLPVPATSVASERVFSKAGLVVSQRRASMKPSSAEKLVCLNHNLRR